MTGPIQYSGTGIGAATLKTSPTRVLHINSGNLYGGVETILVTLARLRRLCPDMEPSYALCHEGRLSQELIAAGVPVHMLGKVRISRPNTVWRARRRLRALLDRERFDLVICHMPWSLAVFGPVVRRAGQRLGFWAHAFHTAKNWLERLARLTPPNVAIANSRFTMGGLRNMFPAVQPVVVHPPVTLTRSPETGRSRDRLRSEAMIKDSSVIIIQVSRMEECKGHLLHLDALARLKNLDLPWAAWIVGGAQGANEERYFERLLERTRELGLNERIRFLGQRSDVPDLLAATDIFCQPNTSPDSFGIAFVEALWAGLPVVTTRMGGAIEVVDETCGILVEPNDPEGLADALRKLIASPEVREHYRNAGAERAMQLCEPALQMQILSNLTRAGSRSSGQQ